MSSILNFSASKINWKATAKGVNINTFLVVWLIIFFAIDNWINVLPNPVSKKQAVRPFNIAFSITCFWKSNAMSGT